MMRQKSGKVGGPVLAILILLALAGAGVLASGGSGYDLSWHTVDGGGGSSSGGGYELGGTAGQADATNPLTGGSYTLTGGFWAGAPCASPQANATRAGGDVVFIWSSGTHDVYRVVGDPYFGSGAQIGTAESSGWAYTESLLGNASQNAFYSVGPSTTCGQRLGEFDFALEPGT